MLGEMLHDPHNPPSIQIDGTIGYVAQKPWILNATIKENILFDNEFDQDAYETALSASCLQSDLITLIRKDQTEIGKNSLSFSSEISKGEKGVNLSGGQKARV